MGYARYVSATARGVVIGMVAALHVFVRRSPYIKKGRFAMLYWAAVFFVIALIAAFFGFGGIAADSAWAAKILFVVFLALTVVSFLFGRRRTSI